MKWLVIVVFVFALQPVATPKSQRTAQPNSAQIANQADAIKSRRNPSLTSAPDAQSTNGKVIAKDQSGTLGDGKQVHDSGDNTHEEDLKIQRKLVWFTGLLVLVGTLQVLVTFLQWVIYRRQAREMRRQRHEMRRQRVVMLRQWKAMGKQSELMEGQLDEMQRSREIENRTLILQYRPRIIVRNAKALKFSFDLGKPWECEVKFQIVNTGGSPARIIGGSINFVSCIAHDIGNFEFKDGKEIPFSQCTLQPGEQTNFQESMTIGIDFDLAWENYRKGLKDKPIRFIFLIGVLRYLDDLDIPRATGIERRYDPQNATFNPGSSEDEYSD